MNISFSDNLQLITSLRNGEPKAYSYLVDTYNQPLCSYAYGLCHDQDMAEDIVQNVFIRIWKKRLALKENFSFKSFLYRSVYNEFIDQYRKQKSVFPLEKKYIEALTSIVEDDEKDDLENLILIVKNEIEKLPPKCKEIFLLSRNDGLSNIEIAEFKGISPKTVEAHITKAFSILRVKVGSKMKIIMFLIFGKHDYDFKQTIGSYC